MHFCTCAVRLGGDLRSVVVRDEFSPVSWPEIEVLRSIHGEDAIVDVKPFISVPQSSRAEKDRLALKYGFEKMEEIFPGRNPQMEMEAAGAKLPAQTPLWWNPLDPDPAGYDVEPEKRDGEQAETKAEAETSPRVLKKSPIL